MGELRSEVSVQALPHAIFCYDIQCDSREADERVEGIAVQWSSSL